MKKILKYSFFTFTLIALAVTMTGCSDDTDDRLIYAQIGETYQFDTWDITIEDISLESELLLDEGDLVFPQPGYIFLTISVQATLTGDESEIFLPSRADEAFGNHAEDGMTRVTGTLNELFYTRVNRAAVAGIVESGDDWTVANTEASPGETLSGIVIFQFPEEDILNEDADFLITFHQIGSDPILRFDLRALLN